MGNFDLFEHKYALITLFLIILFFTLTWHALDKLTPKNDIKENIQEEIVIQDDSSKEEYNKENPDTSYDKNDERYNDSDDYSDDERENRDREYYEHSYRESQNSPDRRYEENRTGEPESYIPENVDTDEYIRSTASRRVGE